ncbi:hypothetical protein O4220_13305 [Rhodococcus ruber]|uniref:STAS/SEC14 domain-containing protein n=1 Tax=Rhodococcus ruber TaxID=1830 RepID=A0ABT4MES7_9NOCA|nr:hypothetical protein [Rhodococcus ruber]MCZ4519495.1 hypothetical protein [Rhodococcus ruber]
MPEPTTQPPTPIPLVIIDVAGFSAKEGMKMVYDTLIASTAQGRPFAAVVTMPAAMTHLDMFSGYRQRISMALTLRAKMKESCRGLGFVSQSRTNPANSRLTRSILEFWGFPVMITGDIEAAKVWAYQHIGT